MQLGAGAAVLKTGAIQLPFSVDRTCYGLFNIKL